MVTTELRFFWRSKQPQLFAEIISNLEFSKESLISDYYLQINATDKASVKWRNPKLEVKTLVKETTEGKLELEIWEKNTIIEKDNKPTGDNWILVKKQRHLLFWNSDLQSISEPGEDSNELYCQIELSEAMIEGSRVCNLCFECGGKPISRQGNLLARGHKKLLLQFPQLDEMYSEGIQKSYAAFILELHNA